GYRVPKRGPLLVDSIRYDREFLRPGSGIRLEARGASGPLEELLERRTWRILKPGPLNVTLQLNGAYRHPSALAARPPPPAPLPNDASLMTPPPSPISYRGSRIAAGELPFTTTLEFPNSKSWLRVTHSVDALPGTLRSVTLTAAYAFQKPPALFDFG